MKHIHSFKSFLNEVQTFPITTTFSELIAKGPLPGMDKFPGNEYKFLLPSPSANALSQRTVTVDRNFQHTEKLDRYVEELKRYFGSRILDADIEMMVQPGSIKVNILDPTFAKAMRKSEEEISGVMANDPRAAH